MKSFKIFDIFVHSKSDKTPHRIYLNIHMKINYPQILKKNMINVLKDVLREIKKNGLREGHHLYITFKTDNKNIMLPKWLKKKYPKEMTIIIQYEYWNLKVFKEKFEILLSINDVKVNLFIPFKSIISFADPYANFGLKISTKDNSTSIKKKKENTNNKIVKTKDNIIDFAKFKKSN